MSTRSSITAKMTDGTFKSVYCHFDGYLDHVGSILASHYDTQNKIETLLSQGDMSSLSEECSKPKGHSFDSPVKGYCVYYGRDRGETGVDARTGATAEEALAKNGQLYNYLWDGETWAVNGRDLLEALAQDEE